MDKPKNLKELREFYCREYVPLYDYFVSEHRLPQELHFEIAAAFDHMMRQDFTDNGDISHEEFERMTGHLKRATYDSFKLVFENGIKRKIDRFMHPRYRNVEDGKFQPRMCELFNRAKDIAINARKKERSFDPEKSYTWGEAFVVWKEILPIAQELTELENSEKILRVENPSFWERARIIGYNLVWSTIGALIGWFLGKIG